MKAPGKDDLFSEDLSWLDDDIRALSLSYSEKSGLQIYRNYTRSFAEHAIEQFRKSLDDFSADLERFTILTKLLEVEDVRFLPVIFCGYTDDMLVQAFTAILPDQVLGGKKSMFSGYGPLSDLAKRIKLAHAFDVLSADLMLDLDSVRSLRNRISHDWNIIQPSEVPKSQQLRDLYPIEIHFPERDNDFAELKQELNDEQILRARFVWLAGRLTYETLAYHRAKAAHVDPRKALYADGGTKLLSEISGICMTSVRKIAVKT